MLTNKDIVWQTAKLKYLGILFTNKKKSLILNLFWCILRINFKSGPPCVYLCGED